MKKSILFLFGAFTLTYCNQPASTAETEEADTTMTEEMVEKEPSLAMIWETDTTLTTNESVLYHDNILYVSNIAGQPTDKDGVGFISKLNTDGEVMKLKWVTGLDAPKGMGIMDDKLYVTNITELVEINLEEGKVVKRYPVADSEFLNDVAIGDGKVYFSDMNTGKLHVLENGKVTTLAENMESPNGLYYVDGNLYALDGSGLVQVSLDGTGSTIINDEVTGGDGLVVIDEDTYLASRWQGEVWLIDEGEVTKLLDSKADKIQTADIGYYPAEQLVLVPRFFSNKVTAYRLEY